MLWVLGGLGFRISGFGFRLFPSLSTCGQDFSIFVFFAVFSRAPPLLLGFGASRASLGFMADFGVLI